MKNNKIVEQQIKVIDEKNKEMAELKTKISELSSKLAKSSRMELTKEVEQTNIAVKKGQKINIKVWLITSSFAIASSVFGLTNLILNIIDRVK